MKGELDRKREAIVCWAIAQDPAEEWMPTRQGATQQQQGTGCFILTKGARQFSSVRPNVCFPLRNPLEAEFRELADQWRSEVMFLSSTTARIGHPAYQRIIQMGPEVIPFLLRELAERGGHWFTALERITGYDPVNPADSGNVPRMARAWIEWGKREGHIR